MENNVQSQYYQTSSKKFFSCRTINPFHRQAFFNEVPVERSVSQKYLGFHLDQELDFNKCINEKISKEQKGIPFIKKVLARNALLTIYKSFFKCI